jgi:predicted nucleotidyltransferase
MDKKTVEQAIREYIDLVLSFLAPSEILLYGSYARDTATSDSDIDIAIIFDKFQGNTIETEIELFKLCFKVDTRIEPIILEESYDPLGFLRQIRSTGRTLYKRVS